MLKLLVGRKVKLMNKQYSMLLGLSDCSNWCFWVAEVYDWNELSSLGEPWWAPLSSLTSGPFSIVPLLQACIVYSGWTKMTMHSLWTLLHSSCWGHLAPPGSSIVWSPVTLPPSPPPPTHQFFPFWPTCIPRKHSHPYPDKALGMPQLCRLKSEAAPVSDLRWWPAFSPPGSLERTPLGSSGYRGPLTTIRVVPWLSLWILKSLLIGLGLDGGSLSYKSGWGLGNSRACR